MDEQGFETRAIHAGQPADPRTGAVVTPISLATTFQQSAVGEHAGFEYGRTGSPTRQALEECIASLEGGAHGLAFASGMAAEDACCARSSHPVITWSSRPTRTAARTGSCRTCSRPRASSGVRST